MNYNDLNYKLRDMQNKLERKKVMLEVTRENNNKFLELKEKYDKAVETKKLLDAYVQSMEILYKCCNSENNKYKRKRLDYVEKFLDEKLDIVFPDDNFSAKIVIDNKYGNNVAYLTLLTADGKERTPLVSEGKFCQQLLSSNSAIALIKCLGVNRLFLDEAYANSSAKNIAKVGNMLKDLVGSGIQIILIEHKEEIYKDIPRREIYVEKDPLEDATKVIYEKDL